MRYTRQTVVGVVWSKEANVVALPQQLLGQSLGVPADTTWKRVRVRGDDPYAHSRIVDHPADAPNSLAVSARRYLKYTFVKVSPEWRRREDGERAQDKREFAAACAEFGADHFLKAYSLVGTRGDCDLMLRSVAPTLDPIHELHVLLNQTGLMRYADISHSYLALTKESVYSQEEQPSDPRPGSERRYFIVYPMWKKREWYALPPDERMRIMRGHIEVGKRYPGIEINTAYSYGLDDQEFVVSFNADDPAEFLDLVHELRSTESSAFTASETPIFTCLSATPERALDALDGTAVTAVLPAAS